MVFSITRNLLAKPHGSLVDQIIQMDDVPIFNHDLFSGLNHSELLKRLGKLAAIESRVTRVPR